jgi:hypothetical protein
VPTLYWGILDLYQGFAISQGLERPKFTFSLVPTPKAIFINFVLRQEKLECFRQKYLPTDFELVPIRFYPEQVDPVFAITLNVYEAVGGLGGFRAEWSTYVINNNESDPKPRFSIIEAQTSNGGFDAVYALEAYFPGLDLSNPEDLLKLIEPPADVFEYSVNSANAVEINVVNKSDDLKLRVSIAAPNPGDILMTRPLTEWMEANDFVYWQQVADILKYDQFVMFASIDVFEAVPGDTFLDTAFGDFVEPDPLPIILWNNKQDLALQPWGNLDSIPTSS